MPSARVIAIACALAWTLPAPTRNEHLERLQAAVLDVERDYLEAIETSDPERIASLTHAVEDAASAARKLVKTRALLTALHRRQTPLLVAHEAVRLRAQLEHEQPLPAPAQEPDLARGRLVYQQACAACHGPQGQGPSRPGLPASSSFLEAEVMNLLSPSEVFLLLRYGAPGTAMPSFELLDAEDQWDVAFFVFTLRLPRCLDQPPMLGLTARSRTRDGELAAQLGDAALACVRGAVR